jgi:hypothetical protein
MYMIVYKNTCTIHVLVFYILRTINIGADSVNYLVFHKKTEANFQETSRDNVRAVVHYKKTAPSLLQLHFR